MRRRLLTLAALTMALAACGSDGSNQVEDGGTTATTAEARSTTGSVERTTTTEAQLVQAEAVNRYFDLLTESQLGQMDEMLELTTPGSPAHLYAQHQIALNRAQGPSPQDSRVVDGGIRSCSEVVDASGQASEYCFDFADFVLDPETDLLESFSVNGTMIDERITSGPPVTDQGVTVRVVTAYQAGGDDLYLNVDVTNDRAGPVTLADYDWAYVAPDGRQIAPTEMGLMAPDVQPGATAGHIAWFEQVPVGGTLRFVGFADDFVTELSMDVPTRA